MNHKNITPGTLVEGSVSSTDISSDEINHLKAQMQDMQLEIGILKETINVLNKDPDISSEKYKKSSPRERLSLDSRLSSDNIMYRVKTTAVCAVIVS